MVDFRAEYKRYKDSFDGFLLDTMNGLVSPSSVLLDAIRYALSGGGKRLRPVLFLAVYDHLRRQNDAKDEETEQNHKQNHHDIATIAEKTCPINAENAWAKDVGFTACAIEALHTYTLVHDDLPCMDNDDFRRGQPSCHKKFGEAVALLAGDSLLNMAYRLLFKAATINPAVLTGAEEFALLAGAEGLIGGQADEMDFALRLEAYRAQKNAAARPVLSKIFHVPEPAEALVSNVHGQRESHDLTRDLRQNQLLDLQAGLLNICKNKTAALFVGAAVLGGVSAHCSLQQIWQLRIFAENFGYAFQLKDDLDDMNTGSFAAEFGKEKTRRLIADFSQKAVQAAQNLGSEFLEKFVDFEQYL